MEGSRCSRTWIGHLIGKREYDKLKRDLEKTLDLLDGPEVWLLPGDLKETRLAALGWLPPLCPKCHGIIGAYCGTDNLTCLRCKTTFAFKEVIKGVDDP